MECSTLPKDIHISLLDVFLFEYQFYSNLFLSYPVSDNVLVLCELFGKGLYSLCGWVPLKAARIFHTCSHARKIKSFL